MLMTVPQVSEKKARALVAHFPTARSLFNALHASSPTAEATTLLSSATSLLTTAAGSNRKQSIDMLQGKFGDNKNHPRIATLLYKMMNSLDPAEPLV